jgi:hypothetical protein
MEAAWHEEAAAADVQVQAQRWADGQQLWQAAAQDVVVVVDAADAVMGVRGMRFHMVIFQAKRQREALHTCANACWSIVRH